MNLRMEINGGLEGWEGWDGWDGLEGWEAQSLNNEDQPLRQSCEEDKINYIIYITRKKIGDFDEINNSYNT